MLSFISCPAILLCYFSLLLSLSSSARTTTSSINANEMDRLALLAIKSQLYDPLGVTNSWNDSVPLCLWTGVTCGHQHQRVTKLGLSNQKIGGWLSPFIGNLSFLRSVHLEDNNFHGEIPCEIGVLFRLKHLMVSNNSFFGTIPANLSQCSNLITFVADDNNLVGEIPAEIGYLVKLEKFSVGRNQLLGQLPASIGNLSALQVIILKENNLCGSIPDTLGQLKRLVSLNFAVNKLSGIVPSSIFNISSIENFLLLMNGLEGNLPFNIGINLPNLKNFVMAQNNFTGPLPNSLSNASNLERLDLAENYFSGKVAIDFSRLKNISFLHLGTNLLGTRTANDLKFITSLTNCSKFEVLALYENQFGGVLPHSIANLSTTMTGIAIGFNQISGTIPSGIRNLVNLTRFTVEYNELIGTIPYGIGELKNLQLLYLNENNLQGRIPSSLGNLTLLNQLALESNHLHGNIPSSLGNCQTLMLLLLRGNKLTGTVPQQILGITTLSIHLDLSHNLLSGPFPSQVGNLLILISLDISKNQFFGHIPATLGGCTSLEYLNLHGNSFSGSIPLSLSALKSIKKLDLSSNSLSGKIPKYLENLSFLEYLNLSYNHFEGEVPTKGIFANTTEISLHGNEKLCGGLPQMNMPSCQSKKSKKSKISLPKVVILVIVSCMIVPSPFVFVFARRRRANKSSRMLHIEGQFPLVTYAELKKATNEFSSSHMIGQGRYGIVYKGDLGENGMLVAVKVINLHQKGASKSFTSECEALKVIRHRNLIKIITVCSSMDFKGHDFKALVYEYMQNKSLEEWLHPGNDQLDRISSLSFIQRLNISIDVALAIEYLHHHCEPPIIHGDLKPSNVLLDHDMVAHVGDFGLAKFLSDYSLNNFSESQSSSIEIKGTVGYVAPEYGMGTALSLSGDVYSFGILLLEMFTRKRPTDSMFNNGLTLHEFVRIALPERVMEIVEPSLLLEERTSNNNVENLARHGEVRGRIEECLFGVLSVGVLCSMECPAERMEMTDVVAKLHAVRENFLSSRI